MTAEIAIMNKEAVALAADSAVTVRQDKGTKIFSTNKIFTLSNFRPIGVMVFGLSSFMDIPWETIIKSYRHQLQNKKFDTLEEYGQDFIMFLENNKYSFFPEKYKKDM
jgi:hypothetical protein